MHVFRHFGDIRKVIMLTYCDTFHTIRFFYMFHATNFQIHNVWNYILELKGRVERNHFQMDIHNYTNKANMWSCFQVNTRIHEFKTGPGVSAVRVAKCCIGDLRGRRDVVYCWRNDVERQIRLNSSIKEEESNGWGQLVLYSIVHA